jgi:flagellar biosynthetic protein FlhB
MAEDDAQERSERPTPKKLDDARKKGQVPRSVDLGAAAVTLTAVSALYLFGGGAAAGLLDMLREGLMLRPGELAHDDIALRQLGDSGARGLLAVMPLFAAVMVAALGAPALIGGWTFSTEALAFKGERLDPIAGIGRMFSVRSLVELLKSLAKFAFVAGLGVLVIFWQLDEIRGLASMIDVPFQLWQFTKQMRMSMQEIREEMKESEGSPESRGRIRSLQEAAARGRMMHEVPKANVVVTNPTHYAVALRYDESRDGAPVVVAKGADEVAARIREVATGHGVPLVSAPPLARVLFRHVELGRPIPQGLFVAVAQVLTYVWQLKVARRQGGRLPDLPQVDPAIEHTATARTEA